MDENQTRAFFSLAQHLHYYTDNTWQTKHDIFTVYKKKNISYLIYFPNKTKHHVLYMLRNISKFFEL